MSFVLDLVCAGLLASIFYLFFRRSLSSALLTLGALVLSLSLSFFLSGVLQNTVSDHVVSPIVERRAGNDLADLFSAPHGSNGKDIVHSLDLGKMVAECPAPFMKLVERYGADPKSVTAAYEQAKTSEAVLEAMTVGYSQALSKGLTFILLFVLTAVLLHLAAKAVESNLAPPPRKPNAARRLGSAVCGVAAGVIVIFALGVALETLIPYLEQESVMLSVWTLRNSYIYEYLNRINPFVQLCIV